MLVAQLDVPASKQQQDKHIIMIIIMINMSKKLIIKELIMIKKLILVDLYFN